MTSQINLRFPDELLTNAKNFAQSNGYINIQEFIRETVREKIYDNAEIREEYKKILQSKKANTFISDKKADELDKQLEIQANQQ